MLKSLAVSIFSIRTTPTYSAKSYLTDAGYVHNYAAKETEFLARVGESLQIEDIQKDLTRGNYKEKLHKLLCWEEKAHIEILEKK